MDQPEQHTSYGCYLVGAEVIIDIDSKTHILTALDVGEVKLRLEYFDSILRETYTTEITVTVSDDPADSLFHPRS